MKHHAMHQMVPPEEKAAAKNPASGQAQMREQIRQLEAENQQLREQNAMLSDKTLAFESVLEDSMTGYWDWHIQDEYEYLSPNFKKMFGYEVEELPHHPSAWQKIIYPEDLPEIFKSFENHVKDGTPFESEVRYYHKNGSTVWVFCRGKIIEWDKDGEPLRMVGCHIDITRLKRAEEKLLDTKLRFQMVVEGARDGIWDWKNIDEETEWWSPRYYELLGYENGEIEPTLSNFKQSLHPDDVERTFEALRNHLEKDLPFDMEYRLKTKSGAFKWFRARSQVQRDETGRAIRNVGSITDIHDRKMAEQAIQEKTEALSRSNAELEQFAYTASHDLQSPLRTISSFADLLARRYKGHLDEKGDKYIDYITSGTKRMKTLIDELLSYSRLGKDDHFDTFESLEALNVSLENLKMEIESANAQIHCEALPPLLGQPGQIVQLFQNLIGNALKFRSNRPVEIAIRAETNADSWLFSVKDNGIGMSPEHTGKIFKIFQRLHTRDQFEGTGIGLSICKKIVENHGGKIWAESQPDEGTTFYFTISTTTMESI